MMTRTLTVGAYLLVSLASGGVHAQECVPGASPSAAQLARRQAAVRFTREIISAEARSYAERGRYAPLADLTAAAAAPVGFVPRITVGEWSYVLSVQDLFDPCGFSLFSDQEGRIYEARPIDPDMYGGDGQE
jgi:hypothetical protein